jgi:hypothetical protein
VRYAYVSLNGSPDPGISRASLVRLVVSVHNSIACTWRSLVISTVVRPVVVARPKEKRIGAATVEAYVGLNQCELMIRVY